MWEQKLRCASILCSLGLPLMMSEHHSGVTELCSDGEVHTMLHFILALRERRPTLPLFLFLRSKHGQRPVRCPTITGNEQGKQGYLWDNAYTPESHLRYSLDSATRSLCNLRQAT